jgi:hypothetical protein
MLSKWQIWDYFSSFNRQHLESYQGLLILNTFDALCLRLVKDHLLRGAGERIVHHKLASEVNKNWILEEFQTLSLFGSPDNFFIHQAQDLNAELMDILTKLDLSDRFVILSFENEAASWKKLVKNSELDILHVEPPRFWELNKLLDFVCQYLRVPLSYEAKSWMLEALENDLGTFYNSCYLVKLNYPESKEISLSEVKELLVLEKLDQFALASLFARKKFKDFFEKLIALEGDFEKMRFFFNFMQSHLIKMTDTSYLNQKPRLTQYDKDLQNTSKLWKAIELVSEVEKFNRWELLCKKKDSFLWHELRESHLRVLSNF